MAKPAQRYRENARKIFERHYGITVPAGYEVHHVLPIRLGGTNSPENLKMVTLEEHKAAHMALYLEHGDFRDLCAYHMIGKNFQEAQLVAASNGGKAAARYFKESGRLQGFQAFDPEFQKEVASQGGKVGGARQFALGLGIHAQTPEERRLLSSEGGKKGAVVIGWKDSATQSENGKRGGPKNKGFRWYRDDLKSYKYTARQQQQEDFKTFLARTGYIEGRIPEPEVSCPHCGKIGTRFALLRGHFNNCKGKLK